MSGGEKAGEMNHCWTGIVGRPVICIWLKCYSNVNQQSCSLKKVRYIFQKQLLSNWQRTSWRCSLLEVFKLYFSLIGIDKSAWTRRKPCKIKWSEWSFFGFFCYWNFEISTVKLWLIAVNFLFRIGEKVLSSSCIHGYWVFGGSRSNHRRCSVKRSVLRNFAKLTGKHLCQSLCFDKVTGRSLQLY